MQWLLHYTIHSKFCHTDVTWLWHNAKKMNFSLWKSRSAERLIFAAYFQWIMFLDWWGSCANVFTVYWAFCPKRSNKIKFLVWLFVPFGLTIKTMIAMQKTLKQFIQRQAAVRNALHYNKCVVKNMQRCKWYIIISNSLPPVKMDYFHAKLHTGVHMNWTFWNFSIQLSHQPNESNSDVKLTQDHNKKVWKWPKTQSFWVLH